MKGITTTKVKVLKPTIFDDMLIQQLLKLPVMIQAENLDSVSKAKLLVLMEALDLTSDHINDYLTKNKHLVNLNQASPVRQ